MQRRIHANCGGKAQPINGLNNLLITKRNVYNTKKNTSTVLSSFSLAFRELAIETIYLELDIGYWDLEDLSKLKQEVKKLGAMRIPELLQIEIYSEDKKKQLVLWEDFGIGFYPMYAKTGIRMRNEYPARFPIIIAFGARHKGHIKIRITGKNPKFLMGRVSGRMQLH